MPMIPSRLPVTRRPSIAVGAQPVNSPAWTRLEPSTTRRSVAIIRVMVRSAVSSVSTPGVLVTAMPAALAAATSIWSTPAPKLAISFSRSPALAISAASILSVIVGASTSQRPSASISAFRLIGSSVTLSSVSNSSRMRVSTESGSLRVTMTFGLRAAMYLREKECLRKKGRVSGAVFRRNLENP